MRSNEGTINDEHGEGWGRVFPSRAQAQSFHGRPETEQVLT